MVRTTTSRIRSITNRLLLVVAALACTTCSDNEAQAQTTLSDMKINITIDGKTLPINLVDNQATQALVAALRESPITYEADDYGGFEKVGALGRSLPTSNQQIATEAGDVILYSGNQIVLFYGTNSWSYTRLGRIEYTTQEELKSFLKAGQGHVQVTLSTTTATGIDTARTTQHGERAYSLSGAEQKRTAAGGVYIVNGKKYIR